MKIPSPLRIRFSKRTRRLSVWIAAAMVLAVFTSGTAAFANGGFHHHRRRIVLGTVASVGANQFTVTKRDGSTKTITVSDTTAFYKTTDAALADAAVGNWIFAIGNRDTGGVLVANRIAIKPARTTPSTGRSGDRWVFGPVTANDGTTLTIGTKSGPQSVKAADGATITKTVKTDFSALAVSDHVVVIARRQDDGTLAARWVHIIATSKALGTKTSRSAVAPAAVPVTEPVKPAGIRKTESETDPSQVRVLGAVKAVSAPNFTLFTRFGDVNVATSGSTTFVKAVFVRDPDGRGHFETSPGSFGDVVVRAKVKVEGRRNGDGSINATKVVVFSTDGSTWTWRQRTSSYSGDSYRDRESYDGWSRTRR
jgi:hypothetical protein